MKRRARGIAGAHVADAVEYTAALDASFFAKHPVMRSYVRPYVAREFWPLDRHVDGAVCDEQRHNGNASTFG
jgi:hypothetical protein